MCADSYCTIELPEYFNLQAVLDNAFSILNDSVIPTYQSSNYDNVNYHITCNKDGKYQWRQLDLIHPVLYANFVNHITKPDNWGCIINRINELQAIRDTIRCCSMPLSTSHNIKRSSISNWFVNFEQESISIALKYNWIGITDITNFYPSIYTHTIPWALVGKDVAKETKCKKEKYYNIIDSLIQGMSYGQTNGIPQGSVLMDFMAEIVLSYADWLLYEKNELTGVSDYKIIRYRDDYRIFTNNRSNLETIMKNLSEILMSLNLKINSSKTIVSDNAIAHCIKPEKSYLLEHPVLSDESLERQLYKIWLYEQKYPNSGQALSLLDEIIDVINSLEDRPTYYRQIISIIVDLMLSNPRNYAKCSAMLSKLLDLLETQEALSIIDDIIKKNSTRPYSDYLELWLQRITISYEKDRQFNSRICSKVVDSQVNVWNTEWIPSGYLFDETLLINTELISRIDRVIPKEVVSCFYSYDNN